MVKIFESHAHYDDDKFDADRKDLLQTLYKNGINKIVNISYDKKSIENNMSLSKEYDFLYSAIGYHPCDCKDMTEEDIEDLRQKSNNKKVVAIGEIGLDYYWDDVDREVQKHWFIRQLKLAKEVNKPVVIHSRDAAKDTLEILQNHRGEGVMHCYSYSHEMAKEFVKLGYYLGIGGVVTFKNSKNIKETVKEIPLEKMIVETDCPYLTPEPFRGKRNNSLYLVYVINKIAEIKNVDPDTVADVTYKNAMKMYRINE